MGRDGEGAAGQELVGDATQAKVAAICPTSATSIPPSRQR